MGTGHQLILIIDKNEYRKSRIPNQKAQSRRANNSPRTVLPDYTTSPSEKGEGVGTTISPVLAQIGPPLLDKNSPVGHR